jgi:hypothetical protein
MGWKVRITALGPQALQKIPQLAELVSRLPGVSKSQAEIGLKSPPYDLPEVKTEADAQKLAAGLSRLGLVCEIKGPPAPKPAAPPIQPSPPKHSIFDIEEAEHPRIPIELREDPTRTKTQSTFAENRPTIILFAVLFVLIGIGAWTANWINERNKPQSPTPVEETVQSQKKKPPKSSPAQKAKDRSSYQKALQQLATSEKFLQDAESTPDVKKSAELLLQAVQYNPYNSKAWKSLAEKYRRLGFEEQAKNCDFRYQYSEETQRKLEGIARYFGGKPKVRVNVAQVHYEVQNDSISAQDFHGKSETLYDTVHAEHPEKQFRIENQGKTTHTLEVNPGEDFPAFDSWDELEKKGKK